MTAKLEAPLQLTAAGALLLVQLLAHKQRRQMQTLQILSYPCLHRSTLGAMRLPPHHNQAGSPQEHFRVQCNLPQHCKLGYLRPSPARPPACEPQTSSAVTFRTAIAGPRLYHLTTTTARGR
ncbi:hypothetical protein ISCGN_002125 [Ixodes scapularis]